MIYSVAQWIENLALGFTIGTNFFVGYIPDKREDGTATPHRAVLIIDQTPSAVYFDVPDRVDFAVQILCRAKDKADAHADAFTIHRGISVRSAINLPDPEYASGSTYVAMTIEANQAPGYILQDAKGRFQYSQNFIFRIRNR